MPSIKELSKLIGREVEIENNGLHYKVKILDARLRFGRVDCLVTPASGRGEQWVEYHGKI